MPININILTGINIYQIDSKEFSRYFNLFNRGFEYERNLEKIVYTEDGEYIKFGYVQTDLPNDEEVIIKISTPVIEISGEKKWIAFLPIALIVDVLIWPERMSKFLNSSHMHQ